MLGLGDIWVSAAYLLVIISALVCVVYGALNWNKGADSDDKEKKEWLDEEIEIEKNL